MKTIISIKDLINIFLDLLYYKNNKCLCCNNEIYNNDYLCSHCKNKINLYEENFSVKDKYEVKCYTCDIYSKIMGNLILKLKYTSKFSIAEFFSFIICNKIKKENLHIDFITFVPSSKIREKERGYNQSEVMARYCGDRLYKKCKRLLVKTKDTRDQIGLDFQARKENVKNAFTLSRYGRTHIDYIKGKKILIVDDVITTGSTAYNCAEVLLDHGAGEVFVIAMAKST